MWNNQSGNSSVADLWIQGSKRLCLHRNHKKQIQFFSLMLGSQFTKQSFYTPSEYGGPFVTAMRDTTLLHLKMLQEEKGAVDCAGFAARICSSKCTITVCYTTCPPQCSNQAFGHGCSLRDSFKPWLFCCLDMAAAVVVALKERLVVVVLEGTFLLYPPFFRTARGTKCLWRNYQRKNCFHETQLVSEQSWPLFAILALECKRR